MAFILDGTSIRRPYSMNESNSTQMAIQRTLSGAITRDLFGDNKRVWTLSYQTTNKDDFDTINAIYQSYLATETAKTWEVTESNYTISETTVHVDLQTRDFNIRGISFISDFELILTEA